jgi:hypothetical protein
VQKIAFRSEGGEPFAYPNLPNIRVDGHPIPMLLFPPNHEVAYS